jgi:TonB-dependent receptor
MVFALGCTLQAMAATGTIAGKAINSATGRGVAGATVKAVGSDRTATSDLDGAYRLTSVPTGNVNIAVARDGFRPLTVANVSVAADETAQLDVPLTPADDRIVTLSAVAVSANAIAGSDIGLLGERQKATAVSDAIGADQFSRLAIGDAAEAMTKVTGASLVDGKYVLIRGLGDRYSNTLLNGVAVPTADPDKRAVQMDQFPADLIESITTAKSFTPDQPGAFSGGSVNVKTKSFPEQFFFSLGTSVALSYNSNTTRADILTAPGHSGDNLAHGASDRAAPDLPTTLPNPTLARIRAQEGNFAPAEQLDAASKAFDNRGYYPGTTKADPNFGASFAVGDRITWGDGEKIFGYTASLTYDRTFEHYENAEKNRYSGIVGAVQPKLLLTSDRAQLSYGKAASFPSFTPPLGVTSSSRLVSWGAFSKLALRPSLNHEVTLDLFHTQSADDRVQRGVGEQAFDYAGAVDEVYSILYTQRSIASAQLAGKSLFPSWHDLQVEWHVSKSRSTQDQPDYRTLSVYYEPATGTFINATGVQPNRFFRELDEDSKEAGVDFTLPFNLVAREARLKFGTVASKGERSYGEQRFQWSLVPHSHAELEAFPGPVGIVARTANSVTFGNTITRLQEPNNYEADQRIGGSYAMVDLPVTARLRAITGARFERTKMEARPVRIPGVNPRDGIIDQTDALPAAGFIFAATPTSNVRLAYGRTIARPTFKELTDIRYEDVFTLDTYVGNPELRLTKIDNVDLRWELFPRRGETIAVSAFYKRMRDPIEVVFRPQAGSIQPQNVERGEVYGVELEFRRRLDFLGQAFAPFSFGSNLALIASSVTIPAAEMASIRLQEPNARGKRELLGQSPYVFNADLTWQGRRTGSAATMSFNVVGPRLSLVQFGSIPDVYEQPAPMLNFVFTQRVWRGLRLKFSAKNLLDPDRKKTIGLIDRELIYERYRTGRTFSLSATYLFE